MNAIAIITITMAMAIVINITIAIYIVTAIDTVVNISFCTGLGCSIIERISKRLVLVHTLLAYKIFALNRKWLP